MTFRWSGRALAACGVTCALLGSPLASPARAWGTVGHEKVAGAVAAVLPSDAEPLLVFGSSLVRHAMDADVRAQQPGTDERFRHRFEVDAYLWWERMFLPLDLLSWEHRFGLDRVRERGLLPWAVGDSYERLVTAFRRHDSNAAAREWADLTHYLADAADPLRCTRDASPELARRIDDRLLDRYRSHLELPPVTHRSTLVHNPVADAYELARQSRSHARAMLEAERRAAVEGVGTPGYDARLWHELGPLLEERLGVAAEAAARFGYSAWVAAGRPALQSPTED
jgi:hypothetical protein